MWRPQCGPSRFAEPRGGRIVSPNEWMGKCFPTLVVEDFAAIDLGAAVGMMLGAVSQLA